MCLKWYAAWKCAVPGCRCRQSAGVLWPCWWRWSWWGLSESSFRGSYWAALPRCCWSTRCFLRVYRYHPGLSLLRIERHCGRGEQTLCQVTKAEDASFDTEIMPRTCQVCDKKSERVMAFFSLIVLVLFRQTNDHLIVQCFMSNHVWMAIYSTHPYLYL